MTLTVTLTQVTPPSGDVCPGQDLVYSCNSTTAHVTWIERRGPVTSTETTMMNALQSTLKHFMIQVVDQQYTPVSIVSTATLTNVLFSYDKIEIDCIAVDSGVKKAAIVSVSGEYLFMKKS